MVSSAKAGRGSGHSLGPDSMLTALRTISQFLNCLSLRPYYLDLVCSSALDAKGLFCLPQAEQAKEM